MGQEPQPKQGKSEAELKEEEELQLVLALSKSEADEKEAAKKKATSDLLAGYTNGITAPAAVKEENREDRREIEQQQPELEKYLDREYWEQQSRGTAKAEMAPQPLVEREQLQQRTPDCHGLQCPDLVHERNDDAWEIGEVHCGAGGRAGDVRGIAGQTEPGEGCQSCTGCAERRGG